MKLVQHPLVARDIRALAAHILDVTGDPKAALRRLDEIDALVADILQAPDLGTRLSGPLKGWRVRHGGQGRALSIVYRPDTNAVNGPRLLIALVAFGGQDWLSRGRDRSGFDG